MHIGLAVRENNRSAIADAAVTAVEYTFERSLNPLLQEGEGDPALAKAYRSLHCLKLSPASTTPPSEAYVDAIANFASKHRVMAISDHIGVTHHRGVDLGHFAPPPFHTTAVRAIARNCELLRKRLSAAGVDQPIFLENIAYFATTLRGCANLDEATFMCEVLRASNCGLLLDVENLHANEVNHGIDPFAFIDAVANACDRFQIHIAGGHLQGQVYFDSHSRSVGNRTWELLRHAIGVLPCIDAVFLERDSDPGPQASDVLRDINTARLVASPAWRLPHAC